MDIVSKFQGKRVSKNVVSVNLLCIGGISYSESVHGSYDLRNYCESQYAAFDAVQQLNSKGHFIDFTFASC